MNASISLSILDYEKKLSECQSNIEDSDEFRKITDLVNMRAINDIHIDIMRPPMIPDQSRFSVSLVEKIYREFSVKIPLVVHLMVTEPFKILSAINEFISEKNRSETGMVIQIESFTSQKEIIESLACIKKMNYSVGICLNLLTPFKVLEDKIVEEADFVLLMSVPMGKGGQKYSAEATDRIMNLSSRFPMKLLEVDGGIEPEIIRIAYKAGARRFVVGSFITRNPNPRVAVCELYESFKNMN